MKVLIVYGKEPDKNCEQLIEASKERGHDTGWTSISMISAFLIKDKIKFWIKGKRMDLPDVCFLRSIGMGDYEQIWKRLDLMELMEKEGVFFMNSAKSFRIARDKFLSLYLLLKSGINVPNTLITESSVFAYRLSKKFKEFVFKPLTASMGFGSMKFKSPDLAYEAFTKTESLGKPIYVQEFLRKRGRDIRAFVIGNKIVAAICRKARKGDWKTNIAQGGIAKPIIPSKELEEISIKASKVLGLEYAGVDLVNLNGKFYVLEVNCSPSWQGIQQATGKNIAELLIKYVEKRVESYRA